MTKEELLKKLKEAGIAPGKWAESGGKEVKLPFVEKQKSALQKVRALLAQQIEKDLKEIQRLEELKKKLEYGGCSGDG